MVNSRTGLATPGAFFAMNRTYRRMAVELRPRIAAPTVRR